MTAPGPGSSKFAWNLDDFHELNWHDATIWGICLENHELVDKARTVWPLQQILLDVDYITQWVPGPTQRDPYSFYVAPMTMRITGVTDLSVNYTMRASAGRMKIMDFWEDSGQWHVAGMGLEMNFDCEAIEVFMRRGPQHSPHQALTLDQRGGVSYAMATDTS